MEDGPLQQQAGRRHLREGGCATSKDTFANHHPIFCRRFQSMVTTIIRAVGRRRRSRSLATSLRACLYHCFSSALVLLATCSTRGTACRVSVACPASPVPTKSSSRRLHTKQPTPPTSLHFSQLRAAGPRLCSSPATLFPKATGDHRRFAVRRSTAIMATTTDTATRNDSRARCVSWCTTAQLAAANQSSGCVQIFPPVPSYCR